jgi:hypothetical protein
MGLTQCSALGIHTLPFFFLICNNGHLRTEVSEPSGKKFLRDGDQSGKESGIMKRLNNIELKHLNNLGKQIFGEHWDVQLIDSTLTYWENKDELLTMSHGLHKQY